MKSVSNAYKRAGHGSTHSEEGSFFERDLVESRNQSI